MSLKFRPKDGRFDWDQMKKSDVEDLVHRLPRDKKSREEFRSFVEGLVRADLGPEHYSLFTEPANVVQLFRVMQLSVEWAVYVQKHEIKRREAAEDAFAKLKAENKGLTAELKRLQEELRKGQSPAFRCPYCPNGKVLVDAERARKHMAKHFDKPAPPPPPPPPPPAPMPQPQNLDELKDYLRRLLDGMPDKSAIASILAWLQENCARRPETKDQHDGVMNKLEALSNKLDNIEAKVSQPAAPRPQTPPRVRTPPPAPRPEPEHIPRPAPPAPPAPESPRSRLRRVLEKRKYHKHIWFKQYPFLLARYPPPPVARIMDALANKRAIVRGMTSDRLQHMQDEIGAADLSSKFVGDVVDTYVAKYYKKGHGGPSSRSPNRPDVRGGGPAGGGGVPGSSTEPSAWVEDDDEDYADADGLEMDPANIADADHLYSRPGQLSEAEIARNEEALHRIREAELRRHADHVARLAAARRGMTPRRTGPGA